MKHILQKIIQRRNPIFQFDKTVTNRMLVSFIFCQAVALLRGSLLLLHGRRSKYMMRKRGVQLQYLSKIRWGNYLKLEPNVFISGLGKIGVVLGDNVSIGAFSRLIAATTLNQIGEGIFIGNNVGIGEFAYLGGAGGLTIGNDCIIGQYFSCHPENHMCDDTTALIRLQGVIRKGIVIGANCWIGSKVTVLDGVSIGNGCVIAAGAVVTKSFPSNSIIGGVPARILRKRGTVGIEDFTSSKSLVV